MINDLKDLDVFIVDDDEAIRDSLTTYLVSLGVKVRTAINPVEALTVLKSSPTNIVITDIRMPQMDGIEFLQKLKERYGDEIEVLIITGHSNEGLAIEALKNGAFDYFRKPLHAREIIESLRRTKQFNELKKENKRLKACLKHVQEIDEKKVYMGQSPASRQMFSLLKRVSAVPETTVLLNGETGTGKEIAARYIHDESKNEESPFIALNCGAIPETLIESELFGHEKGAFTGADKSRSGVFEMAKDGTVFLDEISEMSLAAQTRFLRVLEDRRFRRVGGTREMKMGKTRVIAATHRDLMQCVKDGTFREDLYYRVNVAQVTIPSLREREQDILELSEMFLEEICRRSKRKIKLNEAAKRALKKYEFPGNIRELRNLLERAVIFAQGASITAQDLGLEPLDDAVYESEVLEVKHECEEVATTRLAEVYQSDNLNLQEHERRLVEQALQETSGNHSQASRLLGITPQALYRKLDKYGLRQR